MVTFAVSAKKPVALVATVPELITRFPVNVLVAESVRAPVPFLVRPEEPASTEEIVSLVLFTVIVGVVPPRVIVPPERVMFPEADPKVREFAFTVPETVIVPAARPSEAVPKFKESVELVVVVPEGSVLPVESVLQPWVALFVVGAAHVPPAVPKPAVPPLLSQ